MNPMAPTLPDLGRWRVIVSLPAADPDDLVAAGEVLLQEGFRAWSLPFGRSATLPRLKGLFGRRATIGIHAVTTAAQVEPAVSAGASFLASALLVDAVVTAAGGVPVVLGGLTPNELHAGMGAGAAAVQVIPCDAFGSGYARVLPSMMAGTPVIASGRMEHYQAELWLDSGAIAVWPRGLVTRELVTDADLDGLRRRCQQWRLGE